MESRAELEKLRIDKKALETEVLMLRQQQENDHKYLSTVEHHLGLIEMKQKHMIFFLIKSLEKNQYSCNFFEEIKKRKLSDAGTMKKRKLASHGLCEGSLFEAMKTIDVGDIIELSLEDKRLQLEADMARIQSETQMLHSSDKFRSPIIMGRKVENLSQTKGLHLCFENFSMWNKLIEDNVNYGEEGGEWAKQQNDIVQELEKLNSEFCSIQRIDDGRSTTVPQTRCGDGSVILAFCKKLVLFFKYSFLGFQFTLSKQGWQGHLSSLKGS